MKIEIFTIESYTNHWSYHSSDIVLERKFHKNPFVTITEAKALQFVMNEIIEWTHNGDFYGGSYNKQDIKDLREAWESHCLSKLIYAWNKMSDLKFSVKIETPCYYESIKLPEWPG